MVAAFYEDGLDGGNEYNSAGISDARTSAPPDGGFTEYHFDIYYFSGATLGAHTLAATNDANCQYCLYLYTGCNAAGVCSTDFLAQAGAVNIAAATKNRAAGRMTATATNLKFVEWNFNSDTAVPGGQCVQFGQANTDVKWVGSNIFQGDGGPP